MLSIGTPEVSISFILSSNVFAHKMIVHAVEVCFFFREVCL